MFYIKKLIVENLYIQGNAYIGILFKIIFGRFLMFSNQQFVKALSRNILNLYVFFLIIISS